jgi:hypothetical protein
VEIEPFALPAVGLVFITGLVLLLSWDWRLSITALALQYLGITVLVGISWPIDMAVVKLLAGWMAGAVLGIALLGPREERLPGEKLTVSFILYRVLLAIIVGLVATSLSSGIVRWIGDISWAQACGGVILIGLGLLHLGLTNKPLRVILGLLTVIGGFEIIYAAVESSTLVAGLLAGVTLGLALVGTYLITAPSLEEAV